jgi:hypothetical protein
MLARWRIQKKRQAHARHGHFTGAYTHAIRFSPLFSGSFRQ